MITEKISPTKSLDELVMELGKTYEVKRLDKKSLLINHNGTKIIISKKKKGYDVSPNIPGYAFWIFFILVALVSFLLNIGTFEGINEDNWTDFVIVPAVQGLIFGSILYWIFAEIYLATKKSNIKDFVNSLNQM